MFLTIDHRDNRETAKFIDVLAGAGLAALPLIIILFGAVLASA